MEERNLSVNNRMFLPELDRVSKRNSYEDTKIQEITQLKTTKGNFLI